MATIDIEFFTHADNVAPPVVARFTDIEIVASLTMLEDAFGPDARKKAPATHHAQWDHEGGNQYHHPKLSSTHEIPK